MISEIVFAFAAASAASFAGSLQPGPVNMIVLHMSAGKKYRQALLAAAGGSLPEFLFAWVALHGAACFQFSQRVLVMLSIGVSLALVASGLWLICVVQQHAVNRRITGSGSFLSGLALASTNPQLAVFWMAVLAVTAAHHVTFTSGPAQLAFIAGAGFGAFCVHVVIIAMVRRFSDTAVFMFYRKHINRVTGILLVLAGLTALLMLR